MCIDQELFAPILQNYLTYKIPDANSATFPTQQTLNIFTTIPFVLRDDPSIRISLILNFHNLFSAEYQHEDDT